MPKTAINSTTPTTPPSTNTTSPNNTDYRKAALQAIQNIIQNHCYTDSTDLKLYQGDIDYINQGKAL